MGANEVKKMQKIAHRIVPLVSSTSETPNVSTQHNAGFEPTILRTSARHHAQTLISTR